jgi:formylglycine-generating enzyme required for sulfatase activity
MIRTIALFLIACAVVGQPSAQKPVNCSGPLSEERLTDLIKSQVAEKRLHVIVQTCGVGFELSDTVKSRLRAAGASAELLEDIRVHEPKKATAVTIAAGTKKVNPKDGLTYVWIPPGRFMMGCSPGDSECYDDEKPSHSVSIPRGFWMGQTEVTQEAYRRVTGQDPSYFKGDRRPVEEVNWDEAQAYCQAVEMRLPTVEEWEYAARAGNTSERYGSLDAVAWYGGNSGDQTHEVGQKQPNAWGLYDMLGNAWEWTASEYSNAKALRGGAWGSDPVNARVSGRASDQPWHRSGDIGTRCVGE